MLGTELSRRDGLSVLMRTNPLIAGGVGSALVLAASWLGWFVTTEGARRTGELRLDQWLAIDREAPLVRVADTINVALGPIMGPLLMVAIALLIGLRHRLAGFAFLVVSVIGWLSVGFGKIVFHCQRPPLAAVHALIRETGTDSFPSGHTALAVGIVAALIVALRIMGHPTRWAWLLGVPTVLAVAASRLYLGAHYLGDVIGSLLYVSGTVLLLAAASALLLRRFSTSCRPS